MPLLGTLKKCVFKEKLLFKSALQTSSYSALNISSLYYRNIFISVVLFFLFCTKALAALPIDVVVEGVEPPLYTNILATLRVYLFRDSEQFQEKNLSFLHLQAKEDIKKALSPYGYYSPIISSSLSQENKKWKAVYKVDKGQPVTVTEWNFIVEGDHDDFSINEKPPFKIGDVLVQEKYQKFKQKVLEQAFGEGYLDAHFSERSIKVYPKELRATIQLSLDLGSLYYFGKVSADQDEITEALLLRYINYEEGAPYKSSRLFAFQEALYRSGYFKQVVVKGDIDKAVDGRVPVHIKGIPLDTLNTYTVGIGYATDTGVRGTLGWDNKKINRFGHSLQTSLQVGEFDSSMRASYEIPFLDPLYQKIKLSAAYQDQEWNAISSKLLAVGPALTYSSSRMRYGIGVEFRNEDYSVGDTTGTSELLVPAITFGYLFTPSGVEPKLGARLKNGLYLTASARGSISSAISDISFLQTSVLAKGMVSPLTDWRIIGKLGLGSTIVDDFDELPPTLRFYAGGDNSVRGYGYRDLGAKDDDGNVIGGKYTTYGGLELEKSFTEYFAAATFWDFGGAGLSSDFDLYHGAGVGGRLNLPFGQVRLDAAVPLNEDFTVRIHFSVSGEF